MEMTKSLTLVWTDPATGACLWIGGATFSFEDLDATGATAVLSLYPSPPWLGDGLVHLAHRTFAFDDRHELPDPTAETSAVAWVLVRLERGTSVVVHCHGGLNRSPYIAARVMIAAGIEPERAVRQLLGRRGLACLQNQTFATALLGHPIPESWRRR